MKKIISILTFSFLLFSCSNENENTGQEELTFGLKKTIKEKYDGEIFKFKDTEDFLKFYNDLTNLDSNQFQEFLKIKGDNNSIFYRNLSAEEEEVITDVTLSKSVVETKNTSEIVMSEFLSTIFNYDNKVLIGNEIVLLNEKGELVSASNDKNKVIGFVNNYNVSKNDDTSRHNVNYTKSWTTTSGDKRTTLKIFNESLYINNSLSSSKIYYRIHKQYKSCSFWRCTWKDDNISASYTPNLYLSDTCDWTNNGTNNYETSSSAIFTKKISDFVVTGVCAANTVNITGSFTYSRNLYSTTFTGLTYDFNPH